MVEPPNERSERQVPAALGSPPNVWHQRFQVNFDYPVVFTHGLTSLDNPALAWCFGPPGHRPSRVFAVIDEGVRRCWPTICTTLATYADARGFELVDQPMIVPGGEACKNDPEVIGRLHHQFQNSRLDRHSYVLAIGGGAVLDAVGYAAATTHRGVRLVRAPTTVLAQNDAGIGVKNGINAFSTKNFLGTFAPPFAVINDANFIETLSPRDRVAGIAEAIKVSLVRDRGFFTWLEDNVEALARSESAAMEQMIERCAKHHLDHIRSSGDPFEMGNARPLDFGHWSAHRLETLSEHRVRHGEAVAIGIALDTRYGQVRGMLAEAQCDRIYRLLTGVGLPIWNESLTALDTDGQFAVLQGIDEFREHLGGQLCVTLLTDIGTAVEVNTLDKPTVVECAKWLQQRAERTTLAR